MLYVGMDGWMAWDKMVIIGHGYSKRTLGANQSKTMEWNLTDNCFYLLDNSSAFQSCQLSRPWETFLAECQPFACIFVTVYILYSVLWQILHSWYEIADLFCMTEFFLIIFTIEQLH